MERTRTLVIRNFILDNVSRDGDGVAARVVQAYGISRQAANRHLDLLVEEGLLDQHGNTRARHYRLRRTSALSREFRVTPVLNPDRVWDDHVAPVLESDREPSRDLCRGAFRELVRNAVAHARASWVTLDFASNARELEISVSDDGAGIFSTLASRFNVATPHDAAEEFARRARMRDDGSPARRLMLLARNFDSFAIRSSGVEATYGADGDLWLVRACDARPGSTISFRCRRAGRDNAQTPTPRRRRSSPPPRPSQPTEETARS